MDICTAMDTSQTKTGNDALTKLFEETGKLANGSNFDRQKGYEKLLSIKADNINNPEFLSRLARACCLLSPTEEDIEKQKQLIFEGTKYASMALALDGNCGEIHKWYAALMAKTTEHVGVQEKVRIAHVVKEHLETAIKLKPDDCEIYFLKGRYCFEVAMLSWMERKVATLLFGEALKSTFTEALENFMMAENLLPGVWIENMLHIAKCYIQDKKFTEAVSWLDKASQIPYEVVEEKMALQEILSLQSKYKTYKKPL